MPYMTNEQRRKNEQEWRKRISDWKTSGVSQQEFCRSRDITLSAFQYWSDRLRNELQKRENAEPVKLVLVVNRDAEPSRKMVVRIGAACIDIEAEFDRVILRRVIDVLAEREARS
jgi:hypothetical protein